MEEPYPYATFTPEQLKGLYRTLDYLEEEELGLAQVELEEILDEWERSFEKYHEDE